MQPIQPTHISKRPARSGPSSRTRGKPRQAPATSSVAAALHTPPAGAVTIRFSKRPRASHLSSSCAARTPCPPPAAASGS
uniref:Uncharacterized protein n=1 Tax=Oryza nivara TaxID=4536 RepID=A0A0E0HK91_ORYNI